MKFSGEEMFAFACDFSSNSPQIFAHSIKILLATFAPIMLCTSAASTRPNEGSEREAAAEALRSAETVSSPHPHLTNRPSQLRGALSPFVIPSEVEESLDISDHPNSRKITRDVSTPLDMTSAGFPQL
jgi:hypothetical protein